MCLTATISAAPMTLSMAQAEARSRFGACGVCLSELHRKEERADAHVTERAETVQGKSVHRFIAKNAFGRFWHSGFAPFLGTATRHLNSETRRFISFRR